MVIDIAEQTVIPTRTTMALCQNGMTIMELVALAAGEQFSDHPKCVSPVIATFLRMWGDELNDENRQQLKVLIPVVINTVSTDEDEEQRSWMPLDWLVRVHIPAWLRVAKFDTQAEQLETLPGCCPE